MKVGCVVFILLSAAVPAAEAQTHGAIVGRVRESFGRSVGISGVRVSVVGTELSVLTDYKGRFRIPTIRAGWWSVRVAAAGYKSAIADSVPVHAGLESEQVFFLPRDTAAQDAQVADPLIDPSGAGTRQVLTADDFLRLRLTSVAEAEALWIGAAGTSYRAGRQGAQSLMIDGIPIRKDYDASTVAPALRAPAALLSEAWLDPDALGEQEGNSLAGVEGLVSRDGSDRWRTHLSYGSDRAFTGSADLGFDHLSALAEGPLGAVRVVGALDATGALQAEPHNAPLGDPRTLVPWALPHNSGEQENAAVKILVPMGQRQSLRLLGIHSREQRLIFDPVFKYDPSDGSARATNATLVAAEFERLTVPLTTTVRLSYLVQNAAVSELTQPPDPLFGALSGAYVLRGLDLARALDTAASRLALAGFAVPQFSERTPWSAPAFFLGGGSRGDLLWSQEQEMRLDVGLSAPVGTWHAGGHIALAAGQVQAYQRVLAFLPVGDSVPSATVARFSPVSVSAALRLDGHVLAAAVSAGLSVDALGGRGNDTQGLGVAIGPEVAVALPLGRVTLTGRLARPSVFPDQQFLTNVAFDDSAAGGRFRAGNPELTPEHATFAAVGLRASPWRHTALRLQGFIRAFTSLVQSAAATPLDSSALTSSGELRVHGVEVLVDHGLGRATRVVVSYAYESATYGADNGFRIPRGPGGSSQDALHRFVMFLHSRLPARLDGGAAIRLSSGPPFSGVSSGTRPIQLGVDATVARELRIGGRIARVYMDARNLFDHRTITAWREDTGTPVMTASQINALAQAAYSAHPGPIPYESPRYRTSADLDANGRVEGSELAAMYQLAAEDYAQGLTAYGSPRTVRIGLDLEF